MKSFRKKYIKFLDWVNDWSYEQLKKRVGWKYYKPTKHRKVNGFKITDHALLRYFERIEGYDMDVVCEALTSENLKERVIRSGSGKYPTKNFRVTVLKNTIVTVDADNFYKAIREEPASADYIKDKLTNGMKIG